MANEETPLTAFSLSVTNITRHDGIFTVTLLDNYPDGAIQRFHFYQKSTTGWEDRTHGNTIKIEVPTGSVVGDVFTHRLYNLPSGTEYLVYSLALDSSNYWNIVSSGATANIDSINQGALMSRLVSQITPAPTISQNILRAADDVNEARVIYHGSTSNWSLEVDYFPSGTTATATLVDHGSASDLADCGIVVSSSPADGTTTLSMTKYWVFFDTVPNNAPKTATISEWEQMIEKIKDQEIWSNKIRFSGDNIVPLDSDTPNSWIRQFPAGMYAIDYYRSVLTNQPTQSGILITNNTGSTTTHGKIYQLFIASNGSIYTREGDPLDTTWMLDWASMPIPDGSITINKVDKPVRGDWFPAVPVIQNDGVMEIGRYIDFHNAADGTTDYDLRLISESGHLFIGNASVAQNRVATMADVNSAYTAGTGISITNGVISKLRYDLIAFVEDQGVDPTPITSSSNIPTITQQQYQAIYNFIISHKNDGTLYAQLDQLSLSGVTLAGAVSLHSSFEYDITASEDKGFGIGTLEVLTTGYFLSIIDGVISGSISVVHNTNTGIYYFAHVFNGV